MKNDNVVPFGRKTPTNKIIRAPQEQTNIVCISPYKLYELAFTNEERAKLLEMKRREHGFTK